MRLFFEVAKQSFRRYLTYRAAAVAGLATNLFFGLVRVAVLLALFGDNRQVEGYTVPGLITYTGLTQAVIAYLSMFGWYEFMNSVHSGEVASDLLRPMRLLTFWLAQDMGRAAAGLLLRGVTIMMIYAAIFDLAWPESAAQWMAVTLSIVLGWLVSFGWRFLINLSAFWTPNASGIGRFGFVISWFFSGFLMPLRFLPEWTQRLAYLTPFPHMLNSVVEVYLGVLQGPELLRVLIIQALWSVGLLLLCQLILRSAVRRLVILGG